MSLAHYVDDVSEHCEICRAFDKAKDIPIAGAPAVLTLNRKLQVDLSISDDAIALRAMDPSSKCPLLIPERPQNPQEVWDVFRSSRVAIFGRPKGGEGRHGSRADFCPGSRIYAQFQGVGAHPWPPVRRNSPARGTCDGLAADRRFPNGQILSEVQRHLDPLLPACGYSEYPRVLGHNAVDRLGRGGDDEDLLVTQDTSPSGLFIKQWESRMMAKEAATTKVANGRRIINHLTAWMRKWAIPSYSMRPGTARASLDGVARRRSLILMTRARRLNFRAKFSGRSCIAEGRKWLRRMWRSALEPCVRGVGYSG